VAQGRTAPGTVQRAPDDEESWFGTDETKIAETIKESAQEEIEMPPDYVGSDQPLPTGEQAGTEVSGADGAAKPDTPVVTVDDTSVPTDREEEEEEPQRQVSMRLPGPGEKVTYVDKPKKTAPAPHETLDPRTEAIIENKLVKNDRGDMVSPLGPINREERAERAWDQAKWDEQHRQQKATKTDNISREGTAIDLINGGAEEAPVTSTPSTGGEPEPSDLPTLTLNKPDKPEEKEEPAPFVPQKFGFSLTIDKIKKEYSNLTAEQAIAELKWRWISVRGYIDVYKEWHRDILANRADHPVVGFVVDLFGRRDPPEIGIWDGLESDLGDAMKAIDLDISQLRSDFEEKERKREESDKQRDDERAAQGLPRLLPFRGINPKWATRADWEAYMERHVKGAVQSLQSAAHRIESRRKAVFYYKEGTIATTEDAIKVLKAAKKAGSIAASFLPVGRGLSLLKTAIVSTGVTTAYNATQELGEQSGEMIFSDRTEFDFAKIAKNAAKDASVGFVGALTGGALGRAFGGALARRFGGKLSKQTIERLQVWLVEPASNVMVSPLTTTSRVVFERAVGDRKKLSAGDLVNEIVNGLPEDAIMGFVGAGVSRHADAGSAWYERPTQPNVAGPRPTPEPTAPAPGAETTTGSPAPVPQPGGGDGTGAPGGRRTLISSPPPMPEPATRTATGSEAPAGLPTAAMPAQGAVGEAPAMPGTEAPTGRSTADMPTGAPIGEAPAMPGAEAPTGAMPAQTPVGEAPAMPESTGTSRPTAPAPVRRQIVQPIESPIMANRQLNRQSNSKKRFRLINEKAEVVRTWEKDFGQTGDPPPAWYNEAGDLIVDATRVQTFGVPRPGGGPGGATPARPAPVAPGPAEAPTGAMPAQTPVGDAPALPQTTAEPVAPTGQGVTEVQPAGERPTERQPVAERPTVTETAARTTEVQPAGDRPTERQPVAERPTVTETAARTTEVQPAGDRPTERQPVAERPTVTETAARITEVQPAGERPTERQPVAERPTVTETAARITEVQPAGERPTERQPVSERPTVSQTAVEAPVAERSTGVMDAEGNVGRPPPMPGEAGPPSRPRATGPAEPVEVVRLESAIEANQVLAMQDSARGKVRILGAGEAQRAWVQDYGQTGANPPGWVLPDGTVVIDGGQTRTIGVESGPLPPPAPGAAAPDGGAGPAGRQTAGTSGPQTMDSIAPNRTGGETYYPEGRRGARQRAFREMLANAGEPSRVETPIADPKQAYDLYWQQEAAFKARESERPADFTFDPDIYRAKWQTANGQGEPPPAYVDQYGQLHVDANRVDVHTPPPATGGGGDGGTGPRSIPIVTPEAPGQGGESLSPGPEVSSVSSNQTAGETLGRGRVLALGHYQRNVGGQQEPAFQHLLNEAEAASGAYPILLFEVAPDGKTQFEALAPSSLASSALMQPALAGENGVKAIYINVEAGPVELLPPAAPMPQRAEVGIGGTYQTPGEYRALIPAIAAGDHQVDIYIRHEGGLSIIRARSQSVEGVPLPAELRPHLPPSFATEDPDVAATRSNAQEEEPGVDSAPVPSEISDETTARLTVPQGQGRVVSNDDESSRGQPRTGSLGRGGSGWEPPTREVLRPINDANEAARIFIEQVRGGNPHARAIRNDGVLRATWRYTFRQQTEPPLAWLDSNGNIIIDGLRVDPRSAPNYEPSGNEGE
jgi:hypothetical protein